MHDPVHEEVHHGHTIKIFHEEDAESPRDWCNLGTMVCWHQYCTFGSSALAISFAYVTFVDVLQEFWMVRAPREP